MTRNNLSQHLSWLVNRGLPDFAAVDALLTRPGATADTPNHQIPAPEPSDSTRTELLHRPVTNSRESSKTSTKQLEDVPLNVDGDGDTLVHDATMARLNIASSSSTKPRMLSLNSGDRSDDARPLTPGFYGRKNGGSDDSNARDNTNRAVPATPLDTTPCRRHKRIALPKPFGDILSSDHKTNFDDIESIDLTGDVEHTTSSGTVEAFGDSQTLWREDYAMRPEPPRKRGTKRKSDEYQSDLVSPRISNARLKKSRSPSDDQSSDAPTTPVVFSDPPVHENSSSQELACRSPVRSSVSKNVPIIGDPKNRKEKNEIKSCSGGDIDDSNLFSWDSEEEDDNSSEQMLKEKSPIQEQPKPADTNLSSKSMSTETVAESNTRNVHPLRSSESSLPLPDKRQGLVETVASTPLSQATRDPKVDQFLLLHPAVVDGALEHLNKEVVANAAIVVQHAIEGGLPPAEVIAQGKAYRSKIDALGKIKSERSLYDEKKSRKLQLKDIMVKTVADGGDLTGLAAEIEESQRIVKELQTAEARLSELLSVVDMDLSIFLPQTASHLPATPQTLVRPIAQPISSRYQIDTPQPTPSNDSSISLGTSYQRDVPTAQISKPSTSMPHSNANAFITSDDFDFDEEDLFEADKSVSVGRSQAPTIRSESRRVFGESSGNASYAPPLPSKQKAANHDPNSMLSFPWSKDVRAVMRDRFHLKGFRPNQLEAINATLGGKDAFVLMPTGGGKSLCYQLPSVIHSGQTRGVTIVVSPLLSLMEDQVDHLQKLGIKAFFINGDVSAEHKRWVMSTLSSPAADKELELLYVTPEMISKNLALRDILKRLHQNEKFARLVIDEAHCVSQWGHDFRPDYKELGSFRSEFPGIPVMALTATATENVKIDVINNLGMRGCDILTQSFNRPNLTYDVLPKTGSASDIISQMAAIITTSYRGKAGIVYCLSRKDCEKVASELSTRHNIKATHYHAGMASEERTSIQRDWQRGRHDVIVATIAFGMGIDKPDVRFVIHHTIPKSLEGYYQETGRAGRDGKRSGCYLFYSYRDTTAQRRFIEQSDGDWQQKNRQRQMLRHVVQFCENQSDCRRVQILAYFNESFHASDCHRTCDNCKSDETFEAVDFSEYAKQAIELVKVFKDRDENVTLLHCIDIFAGKYKSMKGDHAQLPQHGAGRDLELGDVERLFYKLVGDDVLAEWSKTTSRFTHRYVKLGSKLSQFLASKSPFTMQVRTSSKATRSSNTSSNRTGSASVSGVADYHPQSTNVPSPVQSARRKATPKAKSKRNVTQSVDEDDDSDGFEPVRVSGKASRRKNADVGPPIVQDDRLAELDDNQQIVVEDFVANAKELSQKIMMERNLRNQPFPDAILREMAIYLPEDTNQMKQIPDIREDKVDRYGSRFLRLIRNSKQLLLDMRSNNEVIHDPNHTNVINLDSDDQYGDDDDFMLSLSQLDPDDANTSQYFDTSTASQSRVPSTQSNRTNASSSTSRKTGSKKSSEPRSRARTGAQQTSSGSSSKRRKAPWNPDAYTYKGQTAKKNYSRSNFRGQGSSSSGGSNYRRSSAGSTGNKRKAPSKTPMPQIDLMPT